ncbi:hypothetical protein A2572_01700 [Candidatus Collierbacteria bacterium RIFOXYD1_FULL_40_9]|uniref:HD domain-containing protein n=1 Tax=Candidatus Collierbacteria bacterium RIFOXYD1_FULL_40_9 TaxID=1817731 RepID=A0A1F5FP88_9BACT|nr:MAG: hypothetical protein A2572_01700 [Candidatus Collierbacteria bacterium RIFOXYD1_FULL_40_9]
MLSDEKILIPDALLETFEAYEKAGFEIYLVGGGVRNILVNKAPENCDLTTNATPEQSLEVLKDFEPFYNNDFGTVSFNVIVNGKEELYEVTTYRSEKEYSDYRRPDNVTWGKTLEEDIVRRDFTINAMVIGKKNQKIKTEKKQNIEWELLDLVGGMEDFEKGIIRAVGEPEQRFREDALRMMRAIRFAARMGFAIEMETLRAIKTCADLLTEISKERVREEFVKILTTNYPADGVKLLLSTKLIDYFLPELLEGRETEQGGHHEWTVLEHSLQSLANCPSPNPLVRLTALTHDIGKPRSQRFKCRRCGKMYKGLSGELFKCEKCGFEQKIQGMITFYGHEVIGARMIKEIMERLRFSRKETEKVETLVRWHMFNYQPSMTDSSIRRLIRNVGKENISDLVLLRISDRKGSGSTTTSWRFLELQKRIGEQLFEPMEINDMVVNGKDVMEILKVAPGPIIGKVLKELFEEVLEDTSKNQREYLLKQIERYK